ncbi:HbrB-like-domain-containing protein [Irpex rosettiformis]|uniref:HbrB-like-domain-containing protein n=1 Tax=Irpex rosettiformis TaxID=378272 RepID=A0ACB8UGC2_9APHY|nr:HbrB-like-domain-containing protein [Irpex rosettiformis]
MPSTSTTTTTANRTFMAGRSAFSRGPRTSGEWERPIPRPGSERQRRSLSDDTLRPPATPEPGSATSSHFHTSGDHSQHPSKRLGFLGEMLSSSTNSGTGGSTRGQSNQIPPRSHSRADSANLLRENAASPAPTMSKAHPSPSKLVSREMHRLGSLAHLPSLNSSISAPSTSSLTVTAQSSGMNVASSGTDTAWPTLHQLILPLFNGEPLKVPIEELNTLVKHHIQVVVSSTPSKALGSLEHDAAEIIQNGMVTLSAKLNGIEDEKMISRVVDLWTFFWGQVLPYVEGALLPLQTEPLLSSLYRMPKSHKPSSPVTMPQHGKGAGSSSFKAQQIDIRTMALQSFRDQIIYPVYHTLHEQLTIQREQAPGGSQHPKLQQMLLVLISQRSLPVAYSLTDPPPSAPPGDEAISLLLRDIRTPLSPQNGKEPGRRQYFAGTGAPSFLSAGLPRDRRGRIAQKTERQPYTVEEYDESMLGEETPKVGSGYSTEKNAAREREREFLESLRYVLWFIGCWTSDPRLARRAGDF